MGDGGVLHPLRSLRRTGDADARVKDCYYREVSGFRIRPSSIEKQAKGLKDIHKIIGLRKRRLRWMTIVQSLLLVLSLTLFLISRLYETSYRMYLTHFNVLSITPWWDTLFWLWWYISNVFFIIYEIIQYHTVAFPNPGVTRWWGVALANIVFQIVVIITWINLLGQSMGHIPDASIYIFNGVLFSILWFYAVPLYVLYRWWPTDDSLIYYLEYFGVRVWLTPASVWITYLSSHYFYAAARARGESYEETSIVYPIILLSFYLLNGVLIAIGWPAPSYWFDYASRDKEEEEFSIVKGIPVRKLGLRNKHKKWNQRIFEFYSYRRDAYYVWAFFFIFLGIFLAQRPGIVKNEIIDTFSLVGWTVLLACALISTAVTWYIYFDANLRDNLGVAWSKPKASVQVRQKQSAVDIEEFEGMLSRK